MCGDKKSIPRGVLHRFSLVLFKQHTYKKKRKGKNTPQWETQAIDLSKPMYYNFKLVIIIDNSHVPMLLCLLSLSLPLLGRFFLSLFLSPLFFPIFPLLPLSSFYSFNPCSYHYNCPVVCQSLRDIFFNFIGFLPSLILEL